MLKKLLILFIAIAPIAAMAQDKFAYINTQEIFALMPEVPGIETQLSEKQEQISKNGQALIDEFNKKNEEFQATASTASESLKADQQKQLEQINERYQLFAQNSQKEFQDLQQKLLAPVNKKISDAIKLVADTSGYTYVFDVSAMYSPLVYINQTTAKNITTDVKTKLGIK
jgi:outer membrane protein